MSCPASERRSGREDRVWFYLHWLARRSITVYLLD
jgi:hypothetical protein